MYDMDEEDELTENDVQFVLEFIAGKKEDEVDLLSMKAKWGKFHADYVMPIVDYKGEEDFITNRTKEYQHMKEESLLLLNAKVSDATEIRRNLRRHPKHNQDEREDND